MLHTQRLSAIKFVRTTTREASAYAGAYTLKLMRLDPFVDKWGWSISKGDTMWGSAGSYSWLDAQKRCLEKLKEVSNAGL